MNDTVTRLRNAIELADMPSDVRALLAEAARVIEVQTAALARWTDATKAAAKVASD